MKKLLCLLTSAAVLGSLCGCSSTNRHSVLICECDLPAELSGCKLTVLFAGPDWDKAPTSITIDASCPYKLLEEQKGSELTDEEISKLRKEMEAAIRKELDGNEYISEDQFQFIDTDETFGLRVTVPNPNLTDTNDNTPTLKEIKEEADQTSGVSCS